MLTTPAPTGLIGDQLVEELTAAGYTDVRVTLLPAGADGRTADELEVAGKTPSGKQLGEANRSKVEGITKGHRPRPIPARPSRAERVAAARAKAAKGDTAGALEDVLSILEQ